MNAIAQAVEDPLLRWVTFRLAEETYGINVMQVQEVLRVTEIAPVPGAPAHVLGIINLRGNVATVIDTRRCFGLPSAEPDEAARILIVESGEDVVGILVDRVAEVVDLHASEIEAPPNVGGGEMATRLIQGMHSRGEELLILVDVHRLLSGDDGG
jgi:purine-binding chemotaxis protein CheW